MTTRVENYINISSAIVSGQVSSPTELATAIADLNDENYTSASLAAAASLLAYAEFVKHGTKLLPGLSLGISVASFNSTAYRLSESIRSGEAIDNSDFASFASDVTAIFGAGAALISLAPALTITATTSLSIFAGVSVLASTALGVYALAADDPQDPAVTQALDGVLSEITNLTSSYIGYDSTHFDYFADRFFVEPTLDNGTPILGSESLHHLIFEAIDPGLPLNRVDSVFGALSNEEGLGAERLVKELEVLLGTGQGQAIATEQEYIDRTLALKGAIDTSALLHIVDLHNVPAPDLHALATQDTDQGRAVRYSLANLLPFAIGSGFSGTAADTAEYEIDNFSDHVLKDRISMLHAVIQRNLNDDPYPESADGKPLYYRDLVTGEVAFVGQKDLSPGAPLYLKDEVENILFGSADDNSGGNLAGGRLADRIYGQGGDDVLIGNEGVDYLEGGRGADTLIGGEGLDRYAFSRGDGHDIISDTDRTGVLQIITNAAAELLVGHQRWESEGVWGRDGEFSWQGEGTDLVIAGGEFGSDDSLTIENFNNGDFGIYLTAPTDDAFDQQYGGIENDTLTGTPEQDQLFGSQGNDELFGLEGDDQLFGGSGSDRLAGGPGHDVIFASDGDDELDGGDGSDDLYGAAGDDLIWGGDGNDRLFGSTGNNSLYGGNGADQIFNSGSGLISGGAGPDDIYGGSERDIIDGGEGNDVLRGSRGNDQISGGDGHDIYIYNIGDGTDVIEDAGNNTLQFTSGLEVNALQYQYTTSGLHINTGGDENTITLSGFNLDDVSGQPISLIRFASGASYSLISLLGTVGYFTEAETVGGEQEDTLNGDWKWETIDGLAGNDRIFGYGGNDALLGGLGNDNLWGMGGDDLLDGGEGEDGLDGGAGDDLLRGGPGDDYFYGGDGYDLLEGGSGNDELESSEGADTLAGGAGDDYYHFYNTDNVIVENKNEGRDTVRTDFSYSLGANIEDLVLASGDIDGTGNSLDNTLLGGNGDNRLNGKRGDDVIDGGGGNDILIGKRGHDTYLFSAGDGQDVLKNRDSDQSSDDRLLITGLDHDDLWFTSNGKHLFIDVIGSDDQIKIHRWFDSGSAQLDSIQTGNHVLLREQVDQLVSAMASFAVPDGVGAFIPEETRIALEPTLTSVWQSVA
jgi:Ca2+-binding RTX toxin-like protein